MLKDIIEEYRHSVAKAGNIGIDIEELLDQVNIDYQEVESLRELQVKYQEKANRLKHALEQLDNIDREMIDHKFLKGLDYKDLLPGFNPSARSIILKYIEFKVNQYLIH